MTKKRLRSIEEEKCSYFAACVILGMLTEQIFEEKFPLGFKPHNILRQYAIFKRDTCIIYQITLDGTHEVFRITSFDWKDTNRVYFSVKDKYLAISSKSEPDNIDWINKKGEVVFSWSRMKPRDVAKLNRQQPANLLNTQVAANSQAQQTASKKAVFSLGDFIVSKSLTQGEKKANRRALQKGQLLKNLETPTV